MINSVNSYSYIDNNFSNNIVNDIDNSINESNSTFSDMLNRYQDSDDTTNYENKLDDNNTTLEDRVNKNLSEDNIKNTEDIIASDEKLNISQGNEEISEENTLDISENIENLTDKEKLLKAKNKLKSIVEENKEALELIKKDNKLDIINSKELKLNSTKEDDNKLKLLKIEKLEEELSNINTEELSESDKELLADILNSIRELKSEIIELSDNSMDSFTKDVKDTILELDNIKDNIDVSDVKVDNSKKEDNDNIIKPAELESKLNTKNIEDNKTLDTSNTIDTTNLDAINSNKDIIDESSIKDIKRQDKLDNNSSLNTNNKISNETELTIVTMKDSSDGVNLKGYNNYNNVSKTHNSSLLSDNIVKFQDLMGKLVEKAQLAISNGKSEVLMSLNPEYLGNVKLKISMDGDNLVGKIFVDNAEIKDIFTKNLDTVISSLNEVGINIEGFDVMLSQDNTEGNNLFEEDNSNNRLSNNMIEDSSSVEETKVDIQRYIVPEQRLNMLI